jgi:hypothetical protein
MRLKSAKYTQQFTETGMGTVGKGDIEQKVWRKCVHTLQRQQSVRKECVLWYSYFMLSFGEIQHVNNRQYIINCKDKSS